MKLAFCGRLGWILGMAKKSSGKQTKARKPSRRSGSSSNRKPSPKSGSELAERIREEIWPVERAVMFRPERLRYVRKMIKPKGCVFCEAAKSGPRAEALLLYRGENAMVVLNKFPYNNGHLLILPRRHCGEFLNLTVDEHRAINECLSRAIDALTKAYAPSGFNVGLNLGSAAGAGIPEHLHYHLIPRWLGDTNFFPLIADSKVVVETLEQTYERLLPYFEDMAEGE
jgi:ATP adenylyltransferase